MSVLLGSPYFRHIVPLFFVILVVTKKVYFRRRHVLLVTGRHEQNARHNAVTKIVFTFLSFNMPSRTNGLLSTSSAFPFFCHETTMDFRRRQLFLFCHETKVDFRRRHTGISIYKTSKEY